MSKKINFYKKYISLVVLVLFFSLVSFYIGIKFCNANGKDKKETTESVEVKESVKDVNSKSNNNVNYDFRDGYADLVEKLLPAVVNISVNGTEEVALINPFEEFFGKGRNNPFGNDMMDQFFGGRNTITRKTASLGSGFFIDDKGHVVTNYHVVKTAKEITITTQDKKEYKAKVIGFDSKTDLAVLKLDSKVKTQYVNFGSSNKSRIGDKVIAIGNPFNLGGTVTSGIVSAKSRKMNGSYDDFIQIDAPINMGNSGGPTFNMQGEVIGINTVIISNSGGNIGLGFAIASDMAQPIIAKLKDGVKLKRGVIGVVIQPVTKEIAEAVGLKSPMGGFVNDVVKESPADVAGIKKGDVITSFDGKEIKDYNDLPVIVGNTEIGKTVDVEILRFGEKVTLKIKIKEQENVDKESNNTKEKEETVEGLVVRELSDDLRQKFRVPDDVNGVMIVKVKDENFIENGFVEAGDVVVQLNETKINKISDFKNAIKSVKSKKRKSAIFYIYRKGTMIISGVSVDN